MRTKRLRLCCFGLVIAAFVMISIGVMNSDNRAEAFPFFLDEWQNKYPNSTLPQRMEQQFGTECIVCHHPTSFSDPGNCYREDLRDLLYDGHDILAALDILDGMDSDGDGFTNGEQINMAHAELPGEIGYNPGLSGCFGNDTCSDSPGIHWTGVSESSAVSPAITGDLNCDGSVNSIDLLTLFGHWGSCPTVGACIADLNGDGEVDALDLLILLGNWG